MNKELRFLLKVIRNGCILSGLMFVSIWATGNLSFILIKPAIIFLFGYVLTELAKRYQLTVPEKRIMGTTLIFP